MATFKAVGLDGYIEELEKLGVDVEVQMTTAVYAGAKVVADAVRNALFTIHIHGDKEYGTPKKPITGLTAQDRLDVINSFGLAPIRNDGGYVNTKAGFDGYSRHKTRKYPDGIPIPLIVRMVESGSTFQRKTPVIRPAVNRARQAALEAMQKALDKEINKTVKEN